MLSCKAKDELTYAWKLQGVQRESRMLRLEERRQGASLEDSWKKAIERYPLTDETKARILDRRRAGRKALVKRTKGKVRAGYKLKVLEERTGIELFDSAYASLGSIEGKIKGTGFGDVAFFKWVRENADEFYRKFYLPALMKNRGVTAPDQPVSDGQTEASEASTEALLKTLTEASQ